jgi:hypothetical protein
VTLPNTPNIRILAMTVAQDPAAGTAPARPLYDDFTNRKPIVIPPGWAKVDAREEASAKARAERRAAEAKAKAEGTTTKARNKNKNKNKTKAKAETRLEGEPVVGDE